MANNYILNQEVFNKAVEEYRKELPNTRKGEVFKWELIEYFKNNWEIDADNFAEMLEKTLKKAQPLLGGGQYFPISMIIEFAKKEPKMVRQMFIELFDDRVELLQRCKMFEKKSKEILVMHYPVKTMHCQDARAISTYLWLYDPAQYHAYKFSICTDIAKYLFNTEMPSNKYERFLLCLSLYDLLNKQLSKQKLLIEESQKYNAEYSKTTYSADDTQSILTVDLVFFISEVILKKGKKINQDVMLNGNTEVEVEGEESSEYPLNQILYGPPGTGKTYFTVEKAVEICAPSFFKDIENLEEDEKRFELKKKYDGLVASNQISFVTFHQSFSYEDFVEGIRAKTEAGQIEYSVEDGIFKKVSEIIKNRNYKERISEIINNIILNKKNIENQKVIFDSETSESQEGIDENLDLRTNKVWVLKKFDKNALSDSHIVLTRNLISEEAGTQVQTGEALSSKFYKKGVKIGDIVIIADSNNTFNGIGIVNNSTTQDLQQIVHIEFIFKSEKSIPSSYVAFSKGFGNYKKEFFRCRLKRSNLIYDALLDDERIYQYPIISSDLNYVLIIDEINRGNIANIFGELITLLEPSKRAGNHDARSVTLPYSKEPFSVPNNLYVIGTMNTSDHSLTKLDLALRRRFDFVELLPNYEILGEIEVYGINIGTMLQTMNERIEVLLGRDYLIGHSYFLPLKDSGNKEQELSDIFKNKIIPLLQEYFFEDWERIQWVLNDQNKPEEIQFIHMPKDNKDIERLFKKVDGLSLTDRRYQINENAFKQTEAYSQIIAE